MPERPRVFRDPVHGLVSFEGEDAVLGRVLDTRPFQRLRRIRQDGFASFVYPGAEHSRFGHALGAFHVARRVTDRLGATGAVARDIKVAALAHDLGHGPFSHAWETAFGGATHEDWGARILAENEELRAALGGEVVDAVGRIFAGRYQPRWARTLVSSELDVDRMDYLLRDAHYTGTGYSLYDLDWMIHALDIAPVPGGGDNLVVDYGRGLNVLAQFLFGRFYMYAQVYYHRTVRAAEHMFSKAMERFATLARDGAAPGGLPAAARLARGDTISVDEYLGLDDARVWCALEDWSTGDDAVLADLAARLTRRRLFKGIEVATDVDQATAARLAQAARGVFGDAAASYYAIDRAERQVVGEGELYVVGHPSLGTVPFATLAAELAPVRPVTTVRVLCAPELAAAFRGILAP